MMNTYLVHCLFVSLQWLSVRVVKNRGPNVGVGNRLGTLFVSAGVEVASLSIDAVIYLAW